MISDANDAYDANTSEVRYMEKFGAKEAKNQQGINCLY